MSPQDRFTEAAANTARERDAWKSKAEKAERERDEALKITCLDGECGKCEYCTDAETWSKQIASAIRERDEAREQRNQAQMAWDDEHDAKLKAEAALGAQTVALASSQAREQELRRYTETLLSLWRVEAQQHHDAHRVVAELETITRVTALKNLLARPSDISALREFGLRVARAVEGGASATTDATLGTIVDAVLGAPSAHPLADMMEANAGPMGVQKEPNPKNGPP